MLCPEKVAKHCYYQFLQFPCPTVLLLYIHEETPFSPTIFFLCSHLSAAKAKSQKLKDLNYCTLEVIKVKWSFIIARELFLFLAVSPIFYSWYFKPFSSLQLSTPSELSLDISSWKLSQTPKPLSVAPFMVSHILFTHRISLYVTDYISICISIKS